MAAEVPTKSKISYYVIVSPPFKLSLKTRFLAAAANARSPHGFSALCTYVIIRRSTADLQLYSTTASVRFSAIIQEQENCCATEYS